MTQTALLIGVAVLLACIAIPEVVIWRQRGLGLGDKTISHYLRGKYGYVTDLGFVVFFAAMQLVAWELGRTVAGVAAAVLGWGVLAAMLTARGAEWLPSINFARRAHVAVTVVALVAALVLIAAESRDAAMLALGAAYPLVVALGFALKAPVAVVEKLGVAMIALWLIAYALV